MKHCRFAFHCTSWRNPYIRVFLNKRGKSQVSDRLLVNIIIITMISLWLVCVCYVCNYVYKHAISLNCIGDILCIRSFLWNSMQLFASQQGCKYRKNDTSNIICQDKLIVMVHYVIKYRIGWLNFLSYFSCCQLVTAHKYTALPCSFIILRTSCNRRVGNSNLFYKMKTHTYAWLILKIRH